MPFLSLISGGIKLVGALVEMASRRQLMDAGAAKSAAANLEKANNAIAKAIAARRAVRHDADSVRADADNRD